MHHLKLRPRGALRALAILVLLLLPGFSVRRACAQPDPRYWRYDQVIGQFQQWQERYPLIFHMEVIATTEIGGEPIWGARISDHAAIREPEPTLIFHAAQHSNEPNGTGAVMIMMNRLLSGYGSDARITSLVDGMQIWFIPIVNVDGHRMVFDGALNWNLWRKNKRDNNNDQQYTCPQDGVDLNRNWDFRWDQQADSSQSSQYYRGPAPFSESEVVAMRDFILRENPLIVMDFHSPFQNSSGNVIYWTWSTSSGLGPDQPFFEPIAQEVATRTQSEVDTIWYRESPGSMTLSKEQNWVYANTGDCVFLMEISSAGFWRDETVDSVAVRAARGSNYLLDRAFDGPGLNGTVVDAVNGRPLAATVEVQEAYDQMVGSHRTDPAYGTYWRLLTPGTYTVTASARGYYKREGSIGVGSSGWTTVTLRMVPLDAADASGGAGGDGAVAGPRILWTENPARGTADVHFRVLGTGSPVRLDLLDASGRCVRTLAEGRYAAGYHEVALRDVASGVYLIRLQADGRTITRKVVTRR